MALIKCPECGKEISDKSESCVHCGYPIKDVIGKVREDYNGIEETKFFTICNKCGNINFTEKARIENTTESQGYPTCIWCGGRIKILAGKRQWMKKSKGEREDIVQEEVQRVKSNPEYDIRMANEYGNNGLRPDLDVQRYCPRCGKNYSKFKTQQSIMTCEFCGTEIESSDMLVSDFDELWIKEKKKLGIDILRDSEPVERLIVKTFLLDNDKFSEVLFNKRLHPEQFKTQSQFVEKNIPKCPTCSSPDIQKISGLSKAGSVALWGIFSRKVHKQWHCNNCGSEW